MKTNEILNALEKAVQKDVKHFLSDFDIDKKSIDKSNGKKFLFITREHGTNLQFLFPSDEYPEHKKRVKYLFGSTNREELLKANFESLEYYINNNAKTILFFDGKTLTKIKGDQARNIYKTHSNSLKNQWEEEERQSKELIYN